MNLYSIYTVQFTVSTHGELMDLPQIETHFIKKHPEIHKFSRI